MRLNHPVLLILNLFPHFGVNSLQDAVTANFLLPPLIINYDAMYVISLMLLNLKFLIILCIYTFCYSMRPEAGI